MTVYTLHWFIILLPWSLIDNDEQLATIWVFFTLPLTTFKSFYLVSSCVTMKCSQLCVRVHACTRTYFILLDFANLDLFLMSFTHFGKSLLIMSSNNFSASFFFPFYRTSVTYILDCLILSYKSFKITCCPFDLDIFCFPTFKFTVVFFPSVSNLLISAILFISRFLH